MSDSKSNNPKGQEAIKTLEKVKKSLTNIKGGSVEEIMDIAHEVLDAETYNKLVLPQYKNFQKLEILKFYICYNRVA